MKVKLNVHKKNSIVLWDKSYKIHFDGMVFTLNNESHYSTLGQVLEDVAWRKIYPNTSLANYKTDIDSVMNEYNKLTEEWPDDLLDQFKLVKNKKYWRWTNIRFYNPKTNKISYL